ncbi:FAD dependent oxidoreductase [Gonapodya prolifera JEL478]|uniref:FAD dependent oxidoreductase n=1 Tax=Gonapodya prolifera (strain JEL478) TaxID=1344416 RepID=A0A139B0I1_GONPJ|nr:FAD dependent oxidoreductase [Gonapodya prolifera JEL478]|eukprot:KXS22484.1 FAD dependent oxidoreductase [Gonapodya prolifera JEL478]
MSPPRTVDGHPLPFPKAESTKSYWLNWNTLQYPVTKPFPASCDVLVIGAGLTGCSAAFHLAEIAGKDLDIAVLDARDVAYGASGRNGGIGRSSFGFAWKFKSEGKADFDMIRNKLAFQEENIASMAQWHKRYLSRYPAAEPILERFDSDALIAFFTPAEAEAERERQARIGTLGGKRDLPESIDAEKVKAIYGCDAAKAGGMVVKPSYAVWTAKFCHALLRFASDLSRVNVQTHTLVHIVRRVAGAGSSSDAEFEFVAHTSKGDVRCKRVIYATNGYSRALLPELLVTPVRGVCGSLIPETAPPFRASVSANHGYAYMSSRPDGRVVLGGFRDLQENNGQGWNAEDSDVDPRVASGIEGFLEKNFGTKTRVEGVWSGTQGWTASGEPVTGQVPNRPGEYVSAGFSGMGMCKCFLSGKQAALLALGRGWMAGFPDVWKMDHRLSDWSPSKRIKLGSSL